MQASVGAHHGKGLHVQVLLLQAALERSAGHQLRGQAVLRSGVGKRATSPAAQHRHDVLEECQVSSRHPLA